MSFDGEQQQGQEDDVNSVLWVGNLDKSVTEAMLYELFLQAGPIKSIRIPKGNDGAPHKGYCFVQFHHDASVPYTISVMEGTKIFGRKLRLASRPGSIHRKLQDQKQIDQRQEMIQQHQQHTQQQQQQQQQWFAAPPQIAQLPANMLVYSSNPQMFQPYTPANMNLAPLSYHQPQLGQVMQIQIPSGQALVSTAPPPQQQTTHMQRNPNFQGNPRQSQQQQQQQVNGYYGMSPHVRNQRPSNNGNPSHFSSASGPPLFQQHPRGPRPPRGGPRHSHHQNGIINNNGNRMSYNQRGGPPPPQNMPPLQQQQPPQQQQQQFYYAPMYQQQPPGVTTPSPVVDHSQQFHNMNQNHPAEPQFYRRSQQQQQLPPNGSTPGGFIYHY